MVLRLLLCLSRFVVLFFALLLTDFLDLLVEEILDVLDLLRNLRFGKDSFVWLFHFVGILDLIWQVPDLLPVRIIGNIILRYNLFCITSFVVLLAFFVL